MIIRVLLLTYYLCLCTEGQTQETFKVNQAFDRYEPNTAYKVVEHNNLYYVGGSYFDGEVGLWTAFYSAYDNSGKLVRFLTERTDTMPNNDISSRIMKDSSGLYYLGAYLGSSKLFHYNFAQDSAWVSHTVDARTYDFLPHDAVYDAQSDRFFIVGFNIDTIGDRHLALLSISDSIVDVFQDSPRFNLKDSGRAIALNSERNLVVHGYRRYPNQIASFIMIFDQEMNLLHTTQDTEDQLDFPSYSGIFVDGEDNILLPAAAVFDGKFCQMIAKLDPQGKLIWKKKLDYNHNNFSLAGQWRSITGTHEKDGYIVAGSESYQNNENGTDTFIVKAAIAKLSLDGDSIWYRTYSYRSGLRVSDAFYDIEPTSDGGYIAVGRSPVFGVPAEEELPWVQSIIIKVDSEGRIDSLSGNNIVLDNSTSISVHPNPTNHVLYLTQSSGQELQISIYSNDGRLIETFSSQSSNHTIVLNVGSYQPGIYNVVSTTIDGKVYNVRFVKS